MFEFGFKLDFLLYIFVFSIPTWAKFEIRFAAYLLEREYCASRGVFVYICFPAFMK